MWGAGWPSAVGELRGGEGEVLINVRGEEGGDKRVFRDAEDDGARGVAFGVVGVREGLGGG